MSAVPNFFLYGEPSREAGARFLHLESLDHRSRPSNWTIRPHAHTDLHHVFALKSGTGVMLAEGRQLPFAAPCLLIVPAGVVHGFAFEAEASGTVLTIAEPYARELIRREPDFAALFTGARCLAAEEVDELDQNLTKLSRELVWQAPGHAAAIEGHLLAVLVQALRLSRHAAGSADPVAGRAAMLVAKFRESIEAKFRTAAPLEAYAASMAVTPAQLRRACHQIAGCAPMRLVQDRILLEAERVLLYTNMSVAEAAAYLGFEDSAYFSRFFAKRTGRPPRSARRVASLPAYGAAATPEE
jgi:AraC family transcriptional activator of pobA